MRAETKAIAADLGWSTRETVHDVYNRHPRVADALALAMGPRWAEPCRTGAETTM